MTPFATRVATALAAAFLAVPSVVHAQVDCVAPRESQDSVLTPPFAPMKQTLLALEDIIRKNSVYQAAPEPVRMRTTIAAGPTKDGGARIFVRAYPPMQGTIRVWTPGRCDVIPQAERVAASVGQIYVFVNYSVREEFLGGNEVPHYDGEVAGYPVYNGWVVMTKDRRLPWIPQTVRDRIDREEQKRQRALDEWNQSKAGRKPLDESAQMKTYEMLKKSDPAGAEQFIATVRQVNADLRKAQGDDPLMDAHLLGQLKALRDYRASFTPAQLDAPAMWADANGDGRKTLDAQIAALQALTPAEQQQVDSLGREARDLDRASRTEKDTATAAKMRERSNELALKVRAIRKAHTEQAFFGVQDARAAYDLTNIRPGTKEQAMAFKPDPTFFDAKDPFRPQLITVNFWSKSEPGDGSPRSEWLRNAKATFDFAAVAALLR